MEKACIELDNIYFLRLKFYFVRKVILSYVCNSYTTIMTYYGTTSMEMGLLYLLPQFFLVRQSYSRY